MKTAIINMLPNARSQIGFSLIELIIVLGLISVLAAIFFSLFSADEIDPNGAERFLAQAVLKIESRQADARRMSGEMRGRNLERAGKVPPLEIDFARSAALADLRIEGVDENGDCTDDETYEKLTCLKKEFPGGNTVWSYAYTNNSLKIPEEIIVAKKTEDLGGISLIADHGRGVLVTKIGFDRAGKGYGFEGDTFKSVPSGSPESYAASPAPDQSPFWAIYFYSEKDENFAAAIAVYPGGNAEVFRFSDGAWLGFKNRQIK